MSTDKINDAAVAFAFDHGPLHAAGRGEADALDYIGDLLVETLADHGLEIIECGVGVEKSERS